MKVYFLLFSFWLLTTDLFGQSITHLSLTYSPVSTFRRISNNNELVSSELVNILDSLDSPFFGGIIKFDISHQFKNHNRISGGISYKRLGKTITKQYWTYEPDLENPYTIPSPDDFYIIEDVAKESYNYLSLSLSFGRNFKLNSKLTITPFVGVDLDYLLSFNSQYEDDMVNYKDLVLAGTAKIQIEYMLSEKWCIQLASIYNQSFMPNSTIEYIHDDRQYADLLDFEVKQFSYYYGVELGIAFKMKK
ncbi:MAG: hypothetical protein ABJH98_13745 [Reichenbachiella sp.]|uniref:hypothetical protein n=1 Tax=Reichenbachiella sp. TaxID=2184521 RepID=UPI003296FE2E